MRVSFREGPAGRMRWGWGYVSVRGGVVLGCEGTAGGCCDGNPVKSDPYKGGAEGQVLPLSGLLPHAETDGPME